MPDIFYPLYPHGKLDSQAEKILFEISQSDSVPISNMTPSKARESFFEKSWLGTPVKNIRIDDITIENQDHNTTLRVYTPKGNSPFPILLFFHGGGFVCGSLNEFDTICTYISQGASCIVVSVDYRLAPEYKYPAAIEDVKNVLNWIQSNSSKIKGDASRIAVAGDSAGANLAAVATLIARENSFPSIVFQVLISPWVDLSSTETKSYKYFGDGLWLSTNSINWYRDNYLQNIHQANEIFASPLLSENLKDLPPALIITAEFDVLRDEGEAYAARLKNSGINVKLSRYNGMLHDFVVLPGLFDKANDAIAEICLSLQKVFY